MEKVGAKKLYGARTDDQTKLGIDVLLKVYRWNNFLNHPMSAFEQAQNDSFAAGCGWGAHGGSTPVGTVRISAKRRGNDARSGVPAPHPALLARVKGAEERRPNPMWGMNG